MKSSIVIEPRMLSYHDADTSSTPKNGKMVYTASISKNQYSNIPKLRGTDEKKTITKQYYVA